ncbi:MAG: hypothetical protein JNL08_19765 [Planctomycetes bacterium]|nr:hypothetical protein [Planctomycetota bacterium]
MNPRLFVALFSAPLLLTGLAAQDLRLGTEVHGTTITATVAGAAAGDLVVLVLGLDRSGLELPGGQVLGVAPDLITGCSLARGEGALAIDVKLPGLERDLVCFAQAVRVCPSLPLEDAAAIGLSPVRELRVPAIRR